MKMFAAFWKKRALKKYARKLSERLSTDYGAGEFYTPAQIKVATAKLKIAPELIIYGYAAFLTEEIFIALEPQRNSSPSYQEARREFLSYVPARYFPSNNFYESGLGMQNGDGSV